VGLSALQRSANNASFDLTLPATSSQLPSSARRLRVHVWAQSYASNPGGIQTFTRFVVQALCDLYPDADIVVFAKNDLGAGARAEGKEQRAEGGRGADKSEVGSRRSEVGGIAEESSRNTRAACAPRILGFGRWAIAMRAIAFAFSALRHARSDQSDLIISTHVNLAPVARLAKKFSSARFAVVGHGIEVWKIQKASVRKSLLVADQLVAVSKFTRSRMADALGVEAESIELLPNTFDSGRFKPGVKPPELLQRYKLTNDQSVILTVARLETTEQYKGYDNVLLAMPRILERFPNARYVIVGEGPDKDRLRALSKELGVQDKVTMAGYVPNDSLRDHYNLCDVFAMPSKGEGFGIVFLEALACGKPVVAGNKDASSEALLNGRLGTLVDPDDVQQIAEAVCSTLSEVSAQSAESKEQRAMEVPPSPGSGVADGGQQSDKDKQPITDNKEARLDPELLRREVIAAFGYERFRERLGEIVGKILTK
jgi:glycosyltransferase involved in cell wall biosynthesis